MKFCPKLRFSIFHFPFSIFCLLLFVVCCLLFVGPAYGQQQHIESSQNVLYQVFENSLTHVRHEVKLTNLTTNYYASEYSLFLGFTDVKNIVAADSRGAIKADITPKETGTEIHVSFNDKVVGKGSILTFFISYDTNEVASKNGNIWEITIPKIKDSPDIGDYVTTLSVPASFGKPTYIKPSSVSGLVFQKKDVLEGISVVFGEYQLYSFSLTYHLRNNRLYPILTEIALPPQNSYQEVLLDSLTPAPLNVSVDKDGNWLAKYRLEASQKIDVVALGTIKTFYTPQKDGFDETNNLSDFLKPQKYWETLDPGIVAKAKELKTPKNIYDYVVKTLTYDYDRIEKNFPRAGAAGVFAQPASAICMEFTDLFIALARAAGIPAREVDGFAYTRNSRLRPVSLGSEGKDVQDILHAWPQYYDSEKQMWISVDPTWGNTSGIDYFDTFDFNHVAFVVKGHDSSYPSPAGSYKESEDLDKKDVDVAFAKDGDFVQKRGIAMSADIPSNTIAAGIPSPIGITITNHGNTLFHPKEVVLTATKLMPQAQTASLAPIPPFGTSTIAFTLKSPSYLDNFVATLTAVTENEEFSQEVAVKPIFLVYLPWIGGGVGGAILFFVAKRSWHLHFQRSKAQDSLRGQGKKPASKSR